MSDATLPALAQTWRAAYTRDTPCVPWADHGEVLADLVRRRGVDEAAWLAQAGVRRGQALSPRDLATLCVPLAALGKDVPFVLGAATLPGHYGLASQALRQASSVAEVLELLTRHAARLCPLLSPRWGQDPSGLTLRWTEACGLPAALRPFVVDWHMAAVVALLRLHTGRALHWRFEFARTAPSDLAQHAVHLGRALHFGAHQDAMHLPWTAAPQQWPRPAAALDARQALAQGADPGALRQPFLAAMLDWLVPQLTRPPSLGEAAQTLGVSPATFKRQLAAHGTHFQAEVDRARADRAWQLAAAGLGPADIASALGYADVSGFRRSQRRWTGLTTG